ncbi:GNAT family N-acetyltransferase [Candidatus Bathyarchaeota archaeon]|nr:GNAT family N-acetyltransferase [Candidatus Bathyarchaeota archaeon]
MNRELIEDEGHRNRFKPISWLEQRMRGFLTGEYKAVVFKIDERPVAYALYLDEGDHIYLRQFFVCRDQRRRGISRESFETLKKRIWPRDKPVTVGVLIENRVEYAFWKAVGFKDYSMELEMPPPDDLGEAHHLD